MSNVQWVETGDFILLSDELSVESSILHPTLSLEVIKDAVVFMMKHRTAQTSKTYLIDDGYVEVVFEKSDAREELQASQIND